MGPYSQITEQDIIHHHDQQIYQFSASPSIDFDIYYRPLDDSSGGDGFIVRWNEERMLLALVNGTGHGRAGESIKELVYPSIHGFLDKVIAHPHERTLHNGIDVLYHDALSGIVQATTIPRSFAMTFLCLNYNNREGFVFNAGENSMYVFRISGVKTLQYPINGDHPDILPKGQMSKFGTKKREPDDVVIPFQFEQGDVFVLFIDGFEELHGWDNLEEEISQCIRQNRMGNDRSMCRHLLGDLPHERTLHDDVLLICGRTS